MSCYHYYRRGQQRAYDNRMERIIEITEGAVYVRVANKRGYDIAVLGDNIDLRYPSSKTRRGRVGHGVAQCLESDDGGAVVVKG